MVGGGDCLEFDFFWVDVEGGGYLVGDVDVEVGVVFGYGVEVFEVWLVFFDIDFDGVG